MWKVANEHLTQTRVDLKYTNHSICDMINVYLREREGELFR